MDCVRIRWGKGRGKRGGYNWRVSESCDLVAAGWGVLEAGGSSVPSGGGALSHRVEELSVPSRGGALCPVGGEELCPVAGRSSLSRRVEELSVPSGGGALSRRGGCPCCHHH